MPETLSITAPATETEVLRAAVHGVEAAPLTGLTDPSAGTLATLLACLACLACGRADRVRPLLRAASATAAGADPALLPLLLERYVAWTGDLRTATGSWADARRLADALVASPPPADGTAAVVHAGALSGLERLATDVGDPQLAARMHRPALRARLTLEATPPVARDALLAAALDLLPPHDVPGGSASPGLDAAVVLHVAHVRLGIAPDATRHRLRIRPQLELLPEPAFAVQGIAVGDDSISLVVDHHGSGVRLRVEQDAGPIPITLLLEPVVNRPPRRAAVDGRDAALVPGAAGRGWRVPVQLVLDHARSLELEY